jgi:hypothetical protein
MSDIDRDRAIDEALEESFPASDPPFFVGAGAKPGTPLKRKKRGRWSIDFAPTDHYPTRT